MELTFPLHSAFLAIPLEDEARWQFQALQDSLKEFDEVLSLQNPQTPHLTLQFWPSVMQIEYEQIIRQAQELAMKQQSFSLKVEGTATFATHALDRVLYLSIPFSDVLARLRKACPWPQIQPFSPHITLARIRHPERFHIMKKKVLKAVSDASFSMSVDRLRLYAEIKNCKQTPLQDFVFRKT